MSHGHALLAIKSDEEVKVLLQNSRLTINGWGDIIKQNHDSEILTIPFRPSNVGSQLNRVAQQAIDWLGVGSNYLIIFDSSNRLRKAEWLIFYSILGINEVPSTANDYRAIELLRENLKHESFKNELPIRVSFALFYILLNEGHISVLSDNNEYTRWVASDDGRLTFCCLDEEQSETRRHYELARSIVNGRYFIPRWSYGDDLTTE
jgi:hypothetical protein